MINQTIAITGILAIAIFGGVRTISEDSDKDLLEGIKSSTVLVKAYKSTDFEDTSYSRGAGTYIHPGIVMTATHIINDDSGDRHKGEIQVCPSNSIFCHTATVLYTNKDTDISLLKIKVTNARPVPNFAMVELGDAVILIGNPTRQDFEITRAYLTGFKIDQRTGVFFYRIGPSDKNLSGYSGGGAYSKYGDFIGMTVMQEDFRDDMPGLILPATVINNMIGPTMRGLDKQEK